jgi:hypothetical protein
LRSTAPADRALSETEVFEAQDDLVYINDTVPGTTRGRDSGHGRRSHQGVALINCVKSC